MSDLKTTKVLLEGYQEFDVAGTKKYVLDTNSGKYDLWMNKRDGSLTKAYTDFCTLEGMNCNVEIGYKEQQNGEYVNKTVMFIKKLSGNVLEPTQPSTQPTDLEARVATLEQQVAHLMSKQPTVTTVDKLATEFGGTITSQAPTFTSQVNNPNVSSPVNPDDAGYDVSNIPL